MEKEIKDHQDKMVKFVIKAKTLQDESGFGVALSINEGPPVPVNLLLESLFRATTRNDLKQEIEEALINKE